MQHTKDIWLRTRVFHISCCSWMFDATVFSHMPKSIFRRVPFQGPQHRVPCSARGLGELALGRQVLWKPKRRLARLRRLCSDGSVDASWRASVLLVQRVLKTRWQGQCSLASVGSLPLKIGFDMGFVARLFMFDYFCLIFLVITVYHVVFCRLWMLTIPSPTLIRVVRLMSSSQGRAEAI